MFLLLILLLLCMLVPFLWCAFVVLAIIWAIRKLDKALEDDTIPNETSDPQSRSPRN